MLLKKGPFRESNPGPVRPERTIIPLDQTDILAMTHWHCFKSLWLQLWESSVVDYETKVSRLRFHDLRFCQIVKSGNGTIWRFEK